VFALLPAASITHIKNDDSGKTNHFSSLEDDDEGISSLEEEEDDDDDIAAIVKSAGRSSPETQESSVSSIPGMKWLRMRRKRSSSCNLSDYSCEETEAKCLQVRYRESLFSNVEV
jgi:hypothetical protein